MADRNWPSLDPRIEAALRVVGRQLRLRTALQTFFWILALALGAFWIGFLVDRVPTFLGGREMPRSARAVFLLATFAVTAYFAIQGIRSGPLRRLSREQLALLLERRFRQLNGRLLTSVQLIHRPVEERDDIAVPLLNQVHQQAAEEIKSLRPQDALRWAPVGLMASVASPLLVACLGLVVLAPETSRLAWSRLLLLSDQAWPRRAALEVVGLEVPLTMLDDAGGPRETQLLTFEENRVRVARGEPGSLRVRASAVDAIVPDVCTVFYRTASGIRGQANMRRSGKVVDGAQAFVLDGPPLDAISENVTLQVRGLDARIDDLRIEVVDPPAIDQLELVIQPPPYLTSQGMVTSVRAFQPGIRVPEGSEVLLRGSATSPLKNVLAQYETLGDESSVTEGTPRLLTETKRFEWSLGPLFKPMTCRLIPVDQQNVRSGSPYRYLISVAPDLPPEVNVRLKGISDAVTPNAILPVLGTITDDYGVLRPTLQLVLGKPDSEDPVSLQRPLALQREGEFSDRVDLQALQTSGSIPALAAGGAITLFVEASDAYDLGPSHLGLSNRPRLEIVSPDEMLARLERQELALRSRLQEVIREVEMLRELLDQVKRDGWPETPASATRALPQEDIDEAGENRTQQLLLLRARQASLQTSKSQDELQGIAGGVADILEELANNRLDTPDRRDRLVGRVQVPLQDLLAKEFVALDRSVDQLPQALGQPAGQPAAVAATDACEQVLLRLDEILRGMLELEGYNELLELVRDLIDDQGSLIEETEKEQKRRVLDLFK